MAHARREDVRMASPSTGFSCVCFFEKARFERSGEMEFPLTFEARDAVLSKRRRRSA